MNPLCPFCGTSRPKKICAKPDRLKKPVDILRCAVCGLIFGWPFPTEEELRQLYSADYFHCDTPLHGGYEDYQGDEEEIKKTFQRRWKSLMRYVPAQRPLRVLDVGCATGIFLTVARDAGAVPFGVERSAYAAEIAQSKGIPVFQGQLEAASFETGSFDVITLWDVIEHVVDPLALLQSCAQRLHDGGILVLSTPDASSMLARLLGSYWLGFRSVGEHLYFFGHPTMRAYLDKAGFETLAMHGIGKYMKWDRLLRRLGYYARIFDWLRRFPHFTTPSSYIYSGDTFCAIARKRTSL